MVAMDNSNGDEGSFLLHSFDHRLYDLLVRSEEGWGLVLSFVDQQCSWKDLWPPKWFDLKTQW